MKNKEYIWYVCYGSNLMRERFMCYIEGKQIAETSQTEYGCKDKSEPKKDEPCIINHKLFFGYSAQKWFGSSVAFIDPIFNPEIKTFARKYLITKEQFFDIIRQENGLLANTLINLNEQEIIKYGSTILFPNNWYGRLLHLSNLDDVLKIPHYTFTCVEDPIKINHQKPFGIYKDIIVNGLKETHHLNNNEINQYLNSL